MSEKMACKVMMQEKGIENMAEEKTNVHQENNPSQENEKDLHLDDITSAEEDGEDKDSDSLTKSSESSTKTDEEEKSDSSKLDKERNARFAELRRKREAEEKAKREQQKREEQIKKDARLEAELSIYKKNTFTGKEIKDAIDLEVYKMQLELDEQGKDPNADLPEYIAQKQREKEAEVQKVQSENDKLQKKLADEVAELRKTYPDVDTAKLADDQLFNQIVDEKKGRWSILEIYEEKIRREESAQKKSKENETSKQIETLTKNSAKQPSSVQGGSSNQDDIMKTDDANKWNSYFRNKYGA